MRPGPRACPHARLTSGCYGIGRGRADASRQERGPGPPQARDPGRANQGDRAAEAPAHERPLPRRYQRERPGGTSHIDTRKLGRIDGIGHRITGDRTGQSSKRGTGRAFLHVAVDDASRLADIGVLASEKRKDAVGFLTRSLAFFRRHGVAVEGVMTDNGSACRSDAFRDSMKAEGLRHVRTRP